MTLGLAERQGVLLDEVTRHCDEALPQDSVYALLHRERDHLFPDELFADLYTTQGRRSVPPSVVATVMVLQKLSGCSDREAADRFTYDVRWRYAAGVGGWEADQRWSLAHTVLVDMRARLRASDDPKRVFRAVKQVAAEAGLIGARRVLDSAPLYDAVATQDTVTLIRSAVRGLLRACPPGLAAEIRQALARDDDYATAGKPVCDWDDAEARARLVDELVRDGMAALAVLEHRELPSGVAEAAELLATVVGQDVEEGEDGIFRIARRIATDRVISTVDPDARHGRKTSSRCFDGYKGHIALDPDSEIVTETAAGPANGGDAEMTERLLGDLAPPADPADSDPADSDPADACAPDLEAAHATGDAQGAGPDTPDADAAVVGPDSVAGRDGESDPPAVYGDAAYGSGESLALLEQLGARAMTKVQPPVAPGGRFAKDQFTIDLDAANVTCPAGHTVGLRPVGDSGGIASFGGLCDGCPLRQGCTSSAKGRSVRVGPHERLLAAARAEQRDPGWQADYRATRPKVERKLAHLLRRRHGGRKARTRGTERVDQDWSWNGLAYNIARLAALGVRKTSHGWVAASA